MRLISLKGKRGSILFLALLIGICFSFFFIWRISQGNPLRGVIRGIPSVAHVTHVVDGDTLDVLFEGQHVRIRLIGVDTPETVDPRKSVQCYGPEASAFTKAMLSDRDVTLSSKPDEDEDKYHRKLRYVSLDGKDVGSVLLEGGYAKSLCARFPHPKCELYNELEAVAKGEKKGRWGRCTR